MQYVIDIEEARTNVKVFQEAQSYIEPINRNIKKISKLGKTEFNIEVKSSTQVLNALREHIEDRGYAVSVNGTYLNIKWSYL